MSSNSFTWNGRQVAFRTGETIATALSTAGVQDFGPDLLGQSGRYFCGVGACQGCLVSVDGRIRESCLTPACVGLAITSAGGSHV